MGGGAGSLDVVSPPWTSMISARTSTSHLPTHVVGRPRLVEAIGRPGARLVVVTGPAGSGKTVAIRQWAAQTDAPVAWLSLDARHTDPEHFLDAVLIALEDLVPGVLEAAFADDPADRAADRAVGRAVQHLAGNAPVTVVLDDLHIIDRSRTTKLLARLVGRDRGDEPPPRPQQPVRSARLAAPLPAGGPAGRAARATSASERHEVEEFFDRFPEVDAGRPNTSSCSPRGPRDGRPACSSPRCPCGDATTPSGSSSGSPAATATWPTSCSTRCCCASPTTSASSC